MKRDSVLSLISIAKKAGKIASGEFQTETAVKSQRAFLVIVSEEASENTAKKFRNMCEFYETPFTFMEKRKHWGQRSDVNSVHRWLCWIRGFPVPYRKSWNRQV